VLCWWFLYKDTLKGPLRRAEDPDSNSISMKK
jgi:hypothetical protein